MVGSRLEAAMSCVSRGWMCILVGPPASGKTSLVRLMAALTGNSLHEFTLSSATDTTELLGCFEQHDLFRRWQEIVKMTYDSLKNVCSFCLSGSKSSFLTRLIPWSSAPASDYHLCVNNSKLLNNVQS